MLQCKKMQDTITGNYIAGFRKGGIVLAVVMSVLMSGCEIIPDAVNPVTWFEDDEKEAPPTAEQRKQEYPKLGAVPKRPPSLETQQSKIAEGLTADLENARYTDEKIKQEAARRAAGTSVAPATRSVPAPRPVPSAPRVSSVPPAPAARSAVPPPPVARPAAPQPVRPTVTAPARRSAVPPPPAAPRPAVRSAAIAGQRQRRAASTGCAECAYATAANGASCRAGSANCSTTCYPGAGASR